MPCSLLDYIENKGIHEGVSQGISQGVQALVETCMELGQDYNSTLQRLMDKFSFSSSQAEEEMKKYWR